MVVLPYIPFLIYEIFHLLVIYYITMYMDYGNQFKANFFLFYYITGVELSMPRKAAGTIILFVPYYVCMHL